MGVPRRGVEDKYATTAYIDNSYIDKHSTDTVMINSILAEVIASKPEDPLTAVHTALGMAVKERADGIPQMVPFGGKVVVEYVWLGGGPEQYFSGIDLRSKTKTMGKVAESGRQAERSCVR